MSSTAAIRRFSSRLLSWKPTGKPQQTLAAEVSISGTALHSGAQTTAKLMPAMAGEGRYFVLRNRTASRIEAVVENAVDSALCTTLCKDGDSVRTVEHLLSAMEASRVDNCRIEIDGGDEVPILDGSSKDWVEAIKFAGLCNAKDSEGNNVDKMAAFLEKPVYTRRNGSLLVAMPSSKVQITCGIDFPQVPDIGFQWLSCFPMDDCIYYSQIASSRTFCIYEEVKKLHDAGLIQGGTLDNALVCSIRKGWLNPPLRFQDEPCRHKVLDLIGDLSLLARDGNQGLPVAHVFAYKGCKSIGLDASKSTNYPRLDFNGLRNFIQCLIHITAGHSLHVELVRQLLSTC